MQYLVQLKYRRHHRHVTVTVECDGGPLDACALAKQRSRGDVVEMWARRIVPKQKGKIE